MQSTKSSQLLLLTPIEHTLNQYLYTIFKLNREAEAFDWYQRFSGLRDHFNPIISPESKILNVGSGTSSKLIFYWIQKERHI